MDISISCFRVIPLLRLLSGHNERSTIRALIVQDSSFRPETSSEEGPARRLPQAQPSAAAVPLPPSPPAPRPSRRPSARRQGPSARRAAAAYPGTAGCPTSARCHRSAPCWGSCAEPRCAACRRASEGRFLLRCKAGASHTKAGRRNRCKAEAIQRRVRASSTGSPGHAAGVLSRALLSRTLPRPP